MAQFHILSCPGIWTSCTALLAKAACVGSLNRLLAGCLHRLLVQLALHLFYVSSMFFRGRQDEPSAEILRGDPRSTQ